MEHQEFQSTHRCIAQQILSEYQRRQTQRRQNQLAVNWLLGQNQSLKVLQGTFMKNQTTR